ncbi:hypothetical protein, partial [Paenibacillus gorillae]|uniref:hypothetical protein n=1 Tax=Paenibacillus gorillae TaxID=1243662 RepID=UPI0005A5D722
HLHFEAINRRKIGLPHVLLHFDPLIAPANGSLNSQSMIAIPFRTRLKPREELMTSSSLFFVYF